MHCLERKGLDLEGLPDGPKNLLPGKQGEETAMSCVSSLLGICNTFVAWVFGLPLVWDKFRFP